MSKDQPIQITPRAKEHLQKLAEANAHYEAAKQALSDAQQATIDALRSSDKRILYRPMELHSVVTLNDQNVVIQYTVVNESEITYKIHPLV